MLERNSFERVNYSLKSFPLRSRVPLACHFFEQVSFVDRDALIDRGVSLTSLSMSLQLAFPKRNSGYAQFLCFQYLDASRIDRVWFFISYMMSPSRGIKLLPVYSVSLNCALYEYSITFSMANVSDTIPRLDLDNSSYPIPTLTFGVELGTYSIHSSTIQNCPVAEY